MMRASIRSSNLFGLAGAVAALWLAAGQPAKAGDGVSLAGVQTQIGDPTGATGVCSFLGMGTIFGTTCPQLPTLSQAVAELAALYSSPLEAVRAQPFANVPMGGDIDAGNPSSPPAIYPEAASLKIGTSFPIDTNVLSGLRPLAFISPIIGSGPATPTQLHNLAATSFSYAVASTLKNSYPDTLFLFYEDIGSVNQNFPTGQVVAKFSLPLVKLTGSTETAVPAILQYKPGKSTTLPSNDKTLDCSASTLSGITGYTTPASVGINCAVVFGATALSPLPHAVFEVSLPLVITEATDPAYFETGYDNFTSPFTADLAPNYGIAPSAAPLCTTTTCPTFPPPATTTQYYPLCADLPNLLSTPVPAVAAFYAISTDGEALLTAPLAPAIKIACPAGM
jgi:hypothetical protein